MDFDSGDVPLGLLGQSMDAMMSDVSSFASANLMICAPCDSNVPSGTIGWECPSI